MNSPRLGVQRLMGREPYSVCVCDCRESCGWCIVMGCVQRFLCVSVRIYGCVYMQVCCVSVHIYSCQ